jgi:mevalonate kinase
LRHGCTEIPFMLGEAVSRHEASSLVSGKITGAGRGGAGDTGSPAEEACMLNPLQLLAEATVRYALS